VDWEKIKASNIGDSDFNYYNKSISKFNPIININDTEGRKTLNIYQRV